MFGNSRNSNVSSVNVWNPFSRWRTVVIALVLALVTGSVGQTPAAQAAPARDLINFELKVVRPKTKLRCGETVTYYVEVYGWAAYSNVPVYPRHWSDISRNVGIEVLQTDKTVGDFVGPYGYLTHARATAILIFPDFEKGQRAKFTFKAKKPGKTTLYFEGEITNQYISDEVQVTVLPCHFQIKTLGDYNALDVNLAAIMDGEMKSDEQGNITGSGTVNWVGDDLSSGDCSSVIDIASSKAELTGSLNESDQLIVNVTYLPAVLTNIGKCENAEASLALNDQALVTPHPVRISISSSGGVSTQSQDLYEPNYYAMHGSVDVIVVPVEDEAVTFMPDDHEARWDDFSRLFGALLALH